MAAWQIAALVDRAERLRVVGQLLSVAAAAMGGWVTAGRDPARPA
jgi:hypothetical protein